MDGAGALAERAGVAVGENGLHLGHDGEGDLFGRVGPEVEADGRMKAGAHFSRDRQAIAREIGKDALGAFFRTEQAEIRQRTREQGAQQRHVVHVMVRHDDGEGVGVGGHATDEVAAGCDRESLGDRETFRSREGRARVRDGDLPAEFVGEAREGLGIVARAEDREGSWRSDTVEKRARVGGGGGGEAGAEWRVGGGEVGDGEQGGPARGEVLRESNGPGGTRRQFFEHDAHDAVATQTDTPDEVVFRSGVVDDRLGDSGGEDVPGAHQDVFLQAAPANGTEPSTIGGQQKSRSGPAIGGALDGREGRQDRSTGSGAEQCSEDGLELLHGRPRGRTRDVMASVRAELAGGN